MSRAAERILYALSKRMGKRITSRMGGRHSAATVSHYRAPSADPAQGEATWPTTRAPVSSALDSRSAP
jgi:hypothetical protein